MQPVPHKQNVKGIQIVHIQKGQKGQKGQKRQKTCSINSSRKILIILNRIKINCESIKNHVDGTTAVDHASALASNYEDSYDYESACNSAPADPMLTDVTSNNCVCHDPYTDDYGVKILYKVLQGTVIENINITLQKVLNVCEDEKVLKVDHNTNTNTYTYSCISVITLIQEIHFL